MEENNLANKIASILTTAPVNFNSDDDDADDTKAKLVSDIHVENDEDIQVQGKYRKQNIDFLSDVDKRYEGKERSRKKLELDEDISSPVSDVEFNDAESSENELDEGDDEEDESENTDNSDASDSDEEYVSDLENQEEDTTNFKTLKDTDVSHQVKKGVCVKNQMNIWEHLLEMRIQVQKCLTAANRMPQFEKYKEIKCESGQEFNKSVQQAKNSVSQVLEKFFLLQNLLWKQYPEMKKFKSKSKENSDEDEEIPSDTEDDNDEDEEDDSEEVPKKRMKLSDFEKEIQDKHNFYKEYRNSVIQKWNDKTRMPVIKNNTNTHSIINHIEHTLADKTKLIKRTQMKRNDYKIVGEEPVEEVNENTQENLVTEYNTEIFDDNDFYHQLLRELIEVKSAELTDPVQLGRQWMQLQNLRSKMKRKIDTKATKGRKIRYAVHTKLVNFMAPIDYSMWSDEAKTELFSSLFGKNQSAIS